MSMAHSQSTVPTDEYRSETIHETNQRRYIYLPSFPRQISERIARPLLANVSVNRLGPLQRIQRTHAGLTTPSFSSMLENYTGRNLFELPILYVEELSQRWHLSTTLLIFNINRLGTTCFEMMERYASFRGRYFNDEKRSYQKFYVDSNQIALLLEFFLQFDVDIFYLKTTTFNGAQLWLSNHGLFCGPDEPLARYQMIPCQSSTCPCCTPVYQSIKTQPWPVVNFNESSKHRFVNGYTSLLNSPTTCSTTNIIYTMICPCGKYEFIDSTASTLSTAMRYHRDHGNRIIHEILTGHQFDSLHFIHLRRHERRAANQMRLYRHSARCPIALRTFLDCNPMYWCFVPKQWDDGFSENVEYFHRKDTLKSSRIHGSDKVENKRKEPRVEYQMTRVPSAPDGYLFSLKQREEQREFFRQLLHLTHIQLPFRCVDLYQYKILATVPENSTSFLRYMIETFFTIHGETHLNMIYPLDEHTMQRTDPYYNTEWCMNMHF